MIKEMKQKKTLKALENLVKTREEYSYDNFPLGIISKNYKKEFLKNLCPLSRKFMKICNWENKNFHVVPVRHKGLTGSGEMNQCHQNVRSIVLRFGGKAVFGYTFFKDRIVLESGKEKFMEQWYNHTVWETPEGKLVDITYNNLSSDTKRIVFMPVYSYTPNDSHYMISNGDFIINEDMNIFASDEIKGIINGSAKPLPTKIFKLVMRKKSLCELKKQTIGVWYDWATFSQSSVGTGKKLTEILPKEEYKETFYGTQSLVEKVLNDKTFAQAKKQLDLEMLPSERQEVQYI
jgi:hypothetical protein